jgi:SAM-dependent methyltransferase
MATTSSSPATPSKTSPPPSSLIPPAHPGCTDGCGQRGLDGRVELHDAKIQDIPVEADSFDVALCIGSTHAFGRFAEALTELARLVKPGGQVLIADGYWKQKPDPLISPFSEQPRRIFPITPETKERGWKRAWCHFYSCVSSEDEWDHYEGATVWRWSGFCVIIRRTMMPAHSASASAPGATLIVAGGVTRSASAFISSANRIRNRDFMVIGRHENGEGAVAKIVAWQPHSPTIRPDELRPPARH